MPHPRSLTFEVRKFQYHGLPCWGVMATSNDVRDLGIDKHWLSEEAAYRALVVYTEHPRLHAHAPESVVLAQFERMTHVARCDVCGDVRPHDHPAEDARAVDHQTPKLTEEQEGALRALCSQYGVEYEPDHYTVNPFDLPPGWAAGWIGGGPTTVYVGVDQNGRVHS